MNLAWELLQAPAFGSMGDTWLQELLAVEWAALSTDRWQYQPWHPSLLGAGLLPILQAVVLVPVMFIALARWEAGGRG